jgi:hypothetical protein
MDTNNFPENLYIFYAKNSSKFEEKVDVKKRNINYVLTAVCLLLIVFPFIIPIGNTLVRIVAVVGLLYFGFSAFFGGKSWYNLSSGGKITKSAIKKFDSGAVDEAELLQLFNSNDFAGLADAPEADNQPLQLYIHEDAAGKEFYLQLNKYFSSSDFRSITDVTVVKEPEYSQFYSVIKSIKST